MNHDTLSHSSLQDHCALSIVAMTLRGKVFLAVRDLHHHESNTEGMSPGPRPFWNRLDGPHESFGRQTRNCSKAVSTSPVGLAPGHPATAAASG